MLQSKKLLRYANLKHGFTTRIEGDLDIRRLDGPKKIGKLAELDHSWFIGFSQIHGANIIEVGQKDRGKIIPNADGGITRDKETFLDVSTADCVPLLLFDPLRQSIGAVHAGWKGIVAGIADAAVNSLVNLGSRQEDIIIAIGPHIGGCCYTISNERVKKIVAQFGDNPQMIYQEGKDYHFDLIVPVVDTIRRCGILLENIDYFLTCTSCQKEKFFSRRRDKTLEYGEMAAFIGMV